MALEAADLVPVGLAVTGEPDRKVEGHRPAGQALIVFLAFPE